jgi:hypothetical protein
MLWKRTRRAVRLDDQLRDYMAATDDDPDVRDDPERTVFMDGNVLMVDQLWLWIVDEKTIVTFFPNQEATTSEEKLLEQTNLHSSIYNELNGDLARRFETAGDLAALIMLHAVTILLDKTLHHDLQVLRIFEESISILVSLPRSSLAIPSTKPSDRVRHQVIQTLPQPRLHQRSSRLQSHSLRKTNVSHRAQRKRPEIRPKESRRLICPA